MSSVSANPCDLLRSFALGATLILCLPSARAVDGCKLLLCMAGNWQNISECVPTVREALRDVARGHVWPQCGLGGSSNSINQFVVPGQCPPQYRTGGSITDNGEVIYGCPFSGVIHVTVDGQPWSQSWWSPSGNAVVEWLPAAKAANAATPGSMDDQFDRDYAAWVAGQPPPARSGPDPTTNPPGGGG